MANTIRTPEMWREPITEDMPEVLEALREYEEAAQARYRQALRELGVDLDKRVALNRAKALGNDPVLTEAEIAIAEQIGVPLASLRDYKRKHGG